MKKIVTILLIFVLAAALAGTALADGFYSYEDGKVVGTYEGNGGWIETYGDGDSWGGAYISKPVEQGDTEKTITVEVYENFEKVYEEDVVIPALADGEEPAQEEQSGQESGGIDALIEQQVQNWQEAESAQQAQSGQQTQAQSDMPAQDGQAAEDAQEAGQPAEQTPPPSAMEQPEADSTPANGEAPAEGTKSVGNAITSVLNGSSERNLIIPIVLLGVMAILIVIVIVLIVKAVNSNKRR